MSRYALRTGLMLIAAILAFIPACSPSDENDPHEIMGNSLAVELAALDTAEKAVDFDENAIPVAISKFCGDCHVLPRPESFVREVWYDEILKGYEFYARSGRDDLQPPALQTVLAFYRRHAPTEIHFPATPEVDEGWRSRFTVRAVRWSNGIDLSPAISSLQWIEFLPEGNGRLLATDMRDGSINSIVPQITGSSHELIGRVDNPARLAPCDLNDDGATDLVIADLGSLNPYDHKFGKVVWFKRERASKAFSPVTITEKLGRVADVSVGDFNGDSQPDLLVAEFGHRTTGSIRLLLNDATSQSSSGNSPPLFREKVLDGRPGTIRIPTHDWDKDGKLDFAAVTSQEFESVEIFRNRTTRFDRYRIASGRDLTFGSVGIELADLDQDGDQDILYVNGDTFDNNFANRSHGIRWLENQGDLSFASHQLAELPGAYHAIAADMDNDDDLDIVAVANLPTTVYPASLAEQNPASIVLLEQVAPLQFELRVLERGTPRYPSLAVADFNDDGKLDFAVGTLLFDTDPPGSPAAALPKLSIWWQK